MIDFHFSSYRRGGGWWRGLQNGWCDGTVWRTGVYAQPALWVKRFQTRKTSAHCKTQGSEISFCSSSSFIYWSLKLTKPHFLSLTYRFCWSYLVTVLRWRSTGSSWSDQRWTRSTSCWELWTWWAFQALSTLTMLLQLVEPVFHSLFIYLNLWQSSFPVLCFGSGFIGRTGK